VILLEELENGRLIANHSLEKMLFVKFGKVISYSGRQKQSASQQ